MTSVLGLLSLSSSCGQGTADARFPGLALAARHGLRLQQGEKKDISRMNGVLEILPIFFLPFLWITS